MSYSFPPFAVVFLLIMSVELFDSNEQANNKLERVPEKYGASLPTKDQTIVPVNILGDTGSASAPPDDDSYGYADTLAEGYALE